MKKIKIKNNPDEGFLEMIERLKTEDHGKMTKEEWDTLVDKWMKVYWDIKHNEKNPLLMSYEDIKKMY